jgi:zinc ribbon protein
MAMRCDKCGAEAASGDNFCGRCGMRLIKTDVVDPTSVGPASFDLGRWLLLGIPLILLSFVLGYWLLPLALR